MQCDPHTAKTRQHDDALRELADVRLSLVATFLIAATGCAWHDTPAIVDADFDHFLVAATQIDYPDVEVPVIDDTLDPNAIDEKAAEQREMTLQEAFSLALERSEVMRDLGAGVLRLPDGASTVYGPALQETDPQFGVEAALSEFDAQFRAGVSGEKNDRRFNNQVFGLRGFLDQDLFAADAEISKRSVIGSQLALRHRIGYDNNNSPTNEFPNNWDSIFEAEARQPLLRGAGVGFNRLAGPNAPPGLPNGVLIARTKTDISLADFEIRVRDFLSNVENAYWDLYFAYRDLDSKIIARDASLKTWRFVKAQVGRPSFNAAKEAQAREQYFRFQQDVVNALKGRPIDRTQVNNGSRGGTFRGVPGVRAAERRLRLIVGLPITDHQLIRPTDVPTVAKVTYDWDSILDEALGRRSELRRQRWLIKRRELELVASKNYLLPQLDLVGRYRWRGFGQDLLDPSGSTPTRFDNAYEDLFSGDFQEWQMGIELSGPIGFRREFAAVRNAELRLAREKAVLLEQQRQVIHDLSNAAAEVDRTFENYELSYNRLIGSREQIEAFKAAEGVDGAELDVVLDAQRRYAAALSAYYQAQAEYVVALKNVHFEKGTLLDYCGVFLAEGPWAPRAYHDAADRERERLPAITPHSVANPPLTLDVVEQPNDQH